MTQKDLLSKLLTKYKDAIIVTSLGNISKDVADIDHPRKVPIKGAMGCAIGVGLGMALNTSQEVVVIIGDGSFLMHMGSMSTVLHHKLPNLKIVIINNNCYHSCGGQETHFGAVKELIPFEIYEIHP